MCSTRFVRLVIGVLLAGFGTLLVILQFRTIWSSVYTLLRSCSSVKFASSELLGLRTRLWRERVRSVGMRKVSVKPKLVVTLLKGLFSHSLLMRIWSISVSVRLFLTLTRLSNRLGLGLIVGSSFIDVQSRLWFERFQRSDLLCFLYEG